MPSFHFDNQFRLLLSSTIYLPISKPLITERIDWKVQLEDSVGSLASRMFFLITDFPIEVLANILNFVCDFRHLLRLRMVGNCILWNKVIQGGINVVSLDNYSRRESVIRTLSTFSQLSELSITWSSSVMDDPIGPALLHYLPCSLRKINFDFQGSIMIWTREITPSEKSSPALFLHHLRGRIPILLKDRFPNLTHLTLQGDSGCNPGTSTREWSLPMFWFFLRGLPRNLQILDVGNFNIISIKLWPCVPPHLTCLNVGCAIYDQLFPPSLCSSLTDLTISSPYSSQTDPLLQIPPGLTRLAYHGKPTLRSGLLPRTLIHYEHCAPMSTQMLQQSQLDTIEQLMDLPPNLQTLRALLLLPRTPLDKAKLKALSLPNQLTRISASDMMISSWDKLPVSLKHLSITQFSARPISLEKICRLSKLETLKFDKEVPIGRLPPGLRSLLGDHIVGSLELLKWLPSTLTHLQLVNLEESNMHLLPRTLIKLDLKTMIWDGSHSLPLLRFRPYPLEDPKQLSTVEKVLIGVEPIATLTLGQTATMFQTEGGPMLFPVISTIFDPLRFNLDLPQDAPIPRNLMVRGENGSMNEYCVARPLSLINLAYPADPFWDRIQWPTSITRLELLLELGSLKCLLRLLPQLRFLDCLALPQEMLGRYDHKQNPSEDAHRLWPRDLLHLGVRGLTYWTSFVEIPKSLTSFCCPNWIQQRDSSELPPSLTLLVINRLNSSTDLTQLKELHTLTLIDQRENIIPHLPPSITSFAIMSSSIDITTMRLMRNISAWPAITRLEVPGSQLSVDQLHQLPNLSFASVKYVECNHMDFFLPILRDATEKLDLLQEATIYVKSKFKFLKFECLSLLYWSNLLLRSLPWFVKHLILTMCKVDRDIGRVLPSGLTYLSFQDVDGLNHISTHSLPSSLLTLKIPANSFSLESFQRIPRGVTKLGLYQMKKIWAHHIRAFPPNLVSLDISFERFNAQTLEALPRNLMKLRLHPMMSRLIPQQLALLPNQLVSLRLLGVDIDDLAKWIPPTLAYCTTFSSIYDMLLKDKLFQRRLDGDCDLDSILPFP